MYCLEYDVTSSSALEFFFFSATRNVTRGLFANAMFYDREVRTKVSQNYTTDIFCY